MRKWLRDPVPEIPEIPEITPAGGQPPVSDPAQPISGICGISGAGVRPEDDLLPDDSVPAYTGAVDSLGAGTDINGSTSITASADIASSTSTDITGATSVGASGDITGYSDITSSSPIITSSDVTGYSDITASFPIFASTDFTGYSDITGYSAIAAFGDTTGATDIGASGDTTPVGDITGSSNLIASSNISGSGTSDITASTDIIGAGAIITDGDTTGFTSTALRQPPQAWGSEDWLAFFGEKAAISEFDHGMSRRQAEALAYQFCLSKWLYEHPVCSNAADGCAVCSETDRPNDALLPIGIAGAGEAWLHRDCVPAWHAVRIAAAVSELAAMNIVAPAVNSITSKTTTIVRKPTGSTRQIGSEN
jgi:hypothetical protein